MKDIRISEDLRITAIDDCGCILRSDMQELEGGTGIVIERAEIDDLIAALRAIVTPVTAHNEASTATPNQTYTWKPGDAWSEYTAAMDGDVVRVPILGTLDANTRIPQP